MSTMQDGSDATGTTTPLSSPPSSAGWSVVRVPDGSDVGDEVFVSPTGDWYARCSGAEVPDVEIPLKSRGMRPLKLRNINHLRPPVSK
jgi:hypothetical protein